MKALVLLLLLGSSAGYSQELSPPASLLWGSSIDFGCCEKVRPVDLGRAFAGPQFAIFEDKLYLFKKKKSQANGIATHWIVDEVRRLPGSIISAGIERSRVKWRNDSLWFKSKSRIYCQDPKSEKRLFLYVKSYRDFSDFEITINGDILLVASWDPKQERSGALLEALSADGLSSNKIIDYPDPLPVQPVSDFNKMLYYQLHFGFESVQIQEFIVIFNPVSRRVFVYSTLNKNFKEIELPFNVRTYKDIRWNSSIPAAKLNDLCWQVLPNGETSAWVVVPQIVIDSGTQRGVESLSRHAPYVAYSLDLVDGSIGESTQLEEGFPYFTDVDGRVKSMKLILAEQEANQ